MLKESSVLIMLLVATASLVGINSIYQYAKGQALPAAKQKQPQLQQQAQKLT